MVSLTDARVCLVHNCVVSVKGLPIHMYILVKTMQYTRHLIVCLVPGEDQQIIKELSACTKFTQCVDVCVINQQGLSIMIILT